MEDASVAALVQAIGALGIRDTAIFGPEIGILGLISNAVFAFLFWQWWRTRCNRT